MNDLLLDALRHRPGPYESTGLAFWDDVHISASMLAAHLDPAAEGATRPHAFVDRSARWIASLCETGSADGGALLDLGCGPGLYAERLHDLGLRVTGIDLSRRSIDYGRASAERSDRAIRYLCASYLETEFPAGAFDLAVIIYCDYGALSPADRRALLGRADAALRPGGMLVLDAFSPAQYRSFADGLAAEFEETGGFWCAEPYLCLKQTAAYPGGLFLERYTVATAGVQHSYNLWNQSFTPDTLGDELRGAGFADIRFFGDAAGAAYDPQGPTLCAVAAKPQDPEQGE